MNEPSFVVLRNQLLFHFLLSHKLSLLQFLLSQIVGLLIMPSLPVELLLDSPHILFNLFLLFVQDTIQGHRFSILVPVQFSSLLLNSF